MCLSRENLWTDGRTDGGMDRETLFYMTLPAKAGGPKTNIIFKKVREINNFHTMTSVVHEIFFATKIQLIYY